jgi:tetratricopeptide (TPR) repeat protein
LDEGLSVHAPDALTMRALTAWVGALWLAGCAAWVPPQTAELRARVPQGLPVQVELTSVPFVAQTPLHCGPASLAMVLSHLGRAVTADELADAVFLPARGGSLQAEMLAGARRQDALGLRIPGRIESVLREVHAGHPVVVLQNLGLSFSPALHYAVVVGYDLGRGEIILRSGTTEREILSLRTFEFTWARLGHWAFVALAPGDLAPTADLGATGEAAVAFERSAAPASAERVYDAMLRRWPDDLLAAIGLGNARMAQGDAAGAARAWEQAALRHDSAAAWNNLALARWRLGDRTGASAALARAQRRVDSAEPAWAATVQSTRQTIEGS